MISAGTVHTVAKDGKLPLHLQGTQIVENGAEDNKEDPNNKWQNSDWEWPSYDEYYNKRGEVAKRVKRKTVEAVAVEKPFQVIYCVKKSIPWPELVIVEVHSIHLREILQKLWPTKVTGTHSVKGRDLYLKLQQLKELLDPDFVEAEPEKMLASAESAMQMQLRHLVRFIENEYANATVELQRMKETQHVSFDMLWTVLTPGQDVVYQCRYTEEEVCGKVRKTAYKFNNEMPPKMVLSVKLEVYDYNGESYRKAALMYEVPLYDDEKPFNELSIYPLRLDKGSAQRLEARFLAQGAAFGYLACAVKYRYMQYTGVMYDEKRMKYSTCWNLTKEKADGRVMVDLFSFSKIVLDCRMGTARPPPSVLRDRVVKTTDISQDPNRMYAPDFVYGFSFRLKKWGRFSVHGFSEINFDGGSSWNQLVMDPMLKEVTEHLVTQHLKKTTVETDSAKGIDPIANKGEGCVIICYGPPGTGKTLTAESLAEKLKAPLWSLNVSELGLSPGELEQKLVNILEIANSWHAVLLLDEADVYLEKREVSTDLTRNAMTGLFLRHLEYYKGVLLLTTNRILTFDDAFRSRISVFLRYPKLTTQQRQIIWTNFLKRTKLEGEPSAIQELVQDMAALELNGREIRNAIQNSQTLADAVNETLACKHVLNATKVLATSRATLEEQ